MAVAILLAIYTFLADVEYQVRAHFEWNLCTASELAGTTGSSAKHLAIAAAHARTRRAAGHFPRHPRLSGAMPNPVPSAAAKVPTTSAGELSLRPDRSTASTIPTRPGRTSCERRFWTPNNGARSDPLSYVPKTVRRPGSCAPCMPKNFKSGPQSAALLSAKRARA
jgi:hypothetical protein